MSSTRKVFAQNIMSEPFYSITPYSVVSKKSKKSGYNLYKKGFLIKEKLNKVEKDNIRLFKKLSGIWTKPNLSNDKYVNYDFMKLKSFNHRKRSFSTSHLKYSLPKHFETPKSTKINQEHHKNHENHENHEKNGFFLPILIKSEATGNEILLLKKKRLLLNNLQKMNSFNDNKVRNFKNYIKMLNFKNKNDKNIAKRKKNIMTECTYALNTSQIIDKKLRRHRLLNKKIKRINDKLYLVRIYDYKKGLKIKISSITHFEKNKVIITEEKRKILEKEFKNNYNLIMENIELEGRKLIFSKRKP